MHPCDQPDKGGCSDSCVKDGDNAKCNCSKNGFKLDPNGKTCCKSYLLRKGIVLVILLYCITLPNKLQKLLNLYFCNETLFIVHPCNQPNKSGCSDSCVKDGDNAKCNCSKNGYKLDSDGKTCCKLYIFSLE